MSFFKPRDSLHRALTEKDGQCFGVLSAAGISEDHGCDPYCEADHKKLFGPKAGGN